MAKPAAAPKCPEAGCNHLTIGHDPRYGCIALKNVSQGRLATRCPCSRVFPQGS
jgi:hypothetical protein